MKFGRKTIATVAASALALAASAGAYAYWSAGGSGTGTGSVASSGGSLVLHGTITSALVPGGSSPVTFTADNSGTSSLYIAAVHVASVSTDKVGCAVADFTMPDVTENQRISAGGSGVSLTNSGTITMADTSVSQDACKGATVSLTLSSN
jgi:hypothetical protein